MMQGMPQEFMKVGLIHFMAYPQCMGGEGPIVETVSAIARDPFFDVVEVTHMKDAAVRQRVRAIFEASRIEPCFGAQPITLGGKLDLNHPDKDGCANAVAVVKAGIDQAAELGCKSVAVLSGPVTEDRDAAKARLVDSLKQLCAYAADKDIRMSLETFDQVPFGKNCLIGPTAEAAEVCAEVADEFPDFGLLLDLSHLPLLGETAEHAINTAGAYLTHVHIGNCAMDDPSHPAYGDNHPRFGAPGTRNDVAELAEFLQVLAETGYISGAGRRIVSFEVKPMPGEDPEAVIAGSKRTLLDAWRRVLIV